MSNEGRIIEKIKTIFNNYRENNEENRNNSINYIINNKIELISLLVLVFYMFFLLFISSKDNKYTYSYKYYDYFNGLCQLWCYYTVVLMLINPTIDPYSIIKASFYQSSNIKKMNALYELKKADIESLKSDESESYIFDKDFIEKEMEKLENLKIKIRKRL